MTDDDLIHRVDKFAVPDQLLRSFLESIHTTHREIDRLDGVVRNEVLVQSEGEGKFNVVTHVVWRDDKSYAKAIETMGRFHEAQGGRPIIPDAIETDRATYRRSRPEG